MYKEQKYQEKRKILLQIVIYKHESLIKYL